LVSNLICILVIILVVVYSLIQFLKVNVSVLFCQIYTFLIYFAYSFYSWVNVVNSVDRLLTIKYPRRFEWFKRFKYQLLILIVIALILFLINIPRTLFIKQSDQIVCVIKDNQIGFLLNLVNLIISNILPFIIILFSTAILLYYLFTQKFKLHQLIVNYKREKEFVKNVFAMDIWFIIFFSPYCIMGFLLFTLNSSIIQSKLWETAFNCGIFLSYLEATCNFFVYFCCNNLFRSYFLSMFKKNRVSNLTNA
jgi:hypothetical protein